MGEHLPPVKVKTFRIFLKKNGLNYNRTNGDHEMWSRKDLKRPIVFPVKKKEIYGRVIINCLRTLEISKKDFMNFLKDIN